MARGNHFGQVLTSRMRMSHPVLGVNQADVILRQVNNIVAVDTNKSFHGGIPFGLATPFAEMHLPRKWEWKRCKPELRALIR